MTPLEALKIVYTEVEYAYDDKIKDKSNRNWNEDYEHYHNYRHAMTTIEKTIKALEIIKNKGIYWDINYQPYEEEDDYRAWDNELWQNVKLTKEEYELLKEVMLWKKD